MQIFNYFYYKNKNLKIKSFRDNNPSHNNMLAFFSGTDNSTLLEEGSQNNHFLSLIVNNAGNYVARITRKIERKVEEVREVTVVDSSEFRTFEDNVVKLTNKTKSTRTEREDYTEVTVEYSNAKIVKYSVDNSFEELDARLNEIKSKGSLNKFTQKVSVNTSTEGLPKMLPVLNNPLTSSTSYITPNQQTIDLDEIDEDAILCDLENSYQKIEVPEDIVKSLCIKVLTGTILLKTLNVPLETWVSKLDNYYTSVIGELSDEDNYNRLSIWISSVIDAVITYSVDDEFENQILAEFGLDDLDYNDTDVFIKAYAYNMIKYLQSLPKNSIVKDCIIEELQTYLPKIKENE